MPHNQDTSIIRTVLVSGLTVMWYCCSPGILCTVKLNSNNKLFVTPQVYANGLISFGEERLPNGELRDLDLEEGTIYPILSPFFADINGQLDIEIRLLQRSVRANVNIFSLDKFLSANGTSFETELMFLVQWREVTSSNVSCSSGYDIHLIKNLANWNFKKYSFVKCFSHLK